MPHINRPFAASAAFAAALSLGTPQAFALDVPTSSSSSAPLFHTVSDAGAPLNYDRYGRYGRYDRYDRDRHRRGHRRGGIDAGDVVAGVLVIGAIAAIAGAASNNRDRRREQVETVPRRDNVRYRDDRRSDSRSDSRGIDSAVDMCVEQVERGNTRVDSVDNASRAADGWRVSGALRDGEGWSCWIDNDGRVRSVDFGAEFSGASAGASENVPSRNSVRFESAAAAGAGQPQMSDAAYARARAGQSGATFRADVPSGDIDSDLRAREEELRSGQQPAYPGGPIEGELYPGGEWVDDGQLTSARVSPVAGRS